MRFRIYRWDVHGRPGVYQGSFDRVQDVLDYPFQPSEEYFVLFDRKVFSIEEFRASAEQAGDG